MVYILGVCRVVALGTGMTGDFPKIKELADGRQALTKYEKN